MSLIEVRNPFTLETVFSQPSQDFDEIDRQIRAAQQASRHWSQLAPGERARHVREALDYFRTHRERIAEDVTREMGKPVAAAAEEVDFMIERAEYMCRFAEDGALEPERWPEYEDDTFEGRLEACAKGVFYIISPWNYPLFCAINGTISALLTGNAVVLKHTSTPSVGTHFANAFGNLAGIDSLLVHALVDFDTSALIIEHSDINHVLFTGSVRGGRTVQMSVAKRAFNQVPTPFIGCSLELGGSDAAYIAEDADLEQAAFWTVKIGRLHNAGQSCCAVKRVYVHQRLYADYLAQAQKIMEEEVCGDPMANETTLGPLHGGPDQVTALMEMMAEAQENGARLVTGGSTVRVGQVDFLRPSLLADVHPQMRVMQEETFGPVLPVMAVASDEAGLEQVVNSRYGLTASVFTTSRECAERFISQMPVGTVYVNRCNFVDARLGWIGQLNSGNGSVTLSPAGLKAFSRHRSVNIDPGLLE